MQRELPVRKHPRLKNYDYSKNGAYYVTLCVENKYEMLGEIVGRGLAPAEVALTSIGKIAQEQLIDLQNRFSCVNIDKYVIMPTHIHVIIIINDATAGATTKIYGATAGASHRPTLMDIICAFKSLSTRICNKQDNIQGRKIWQTSFYEEIIRNEKAHNEIRRYIEENPARWSEDRYFI